MPEIEYAVMRPDYHWAMEQLSDPVMTMELSPFDLDLLRRYSAVLDRSSVSRWAARRKEGTDPPTLEVRFFREKDITAKLLEKPSRG